MEKKQVLERLNVMIPGELKRRATEIAEDKGLTLSSYVRMILVAEIKKAN